MKELVCRWFHVSKYVHSVYEFTTIDSFTQTFEKFFFKKLYSQEQL